MDPVDNPLHIFIAACLDWLDEDDPTHLPLPSLEGMTPEEVRRARMWLRHLGETRDTIEMLARLRG